MKRNNPTPRLKAFIALIDASKTTLSKPDYNLGELLDAILKETQFQKHLQSTDKDKWEARWDNVLVRSVHLR
jgi:hypothetical protein